MQRTPDWQYDEVQSKTCEECEATFETKVKVPICPQCQENAFHRGMAKVEAPEGGWPRGSDMDRL